MPHGWIYGYNQAERLLWQNPEQILSEIGLKSGDTLVDLGAGDGFFSIPAAKMVGEAGLVYALDASQEALDILKAKVSETNLVNLRAIAADAEEKAACSRCADVVLLANVLHDFDNPLRVLARVKEMLKPGGQVADLDWKKEPQQQHGPPLAKRLDQDEATALLNQGGFRIIRKTLSGPFHYLLLATAD